MDYLSMGFSVVAGLGIFLLGMKYMSEGLQTIAVLPVLYQGRVIAVINVASHYQEHLDSSVRTALETVASQVGSAISHAKALEQLRESEERYRELFARHPVAQYRIRPDGEVVEANAALVALLDCL